jgi:hypothetical protein
MLVTNFRNFPEYPGINEFIVEDYQSTDDLIIPVVDIGLQEGFSLFEFLGDNQTAEISLTFGKKNQIHKIKSLSYLLPQLRISGPSLVNLESGLPLRFLF